MKRLAYKTAVKSVRQILPSFPTALLILGIPTAALSMPITEQFEVAPLLIAQVIPDSSLDVEQSQVIPINPLVNRIEGGAIRGNNLFHSFEEFNIGQGQSVYFAHPSDIVTILGRVTGNNGSNILGTLGVDGSADLFLLNPNGILFGPDARLDIQGSFIATTNNSFVFSDGEAFSANNPEPPPLLTLSVSPGIQFGGDPQGNITSLGNLEAGQNLTLVGNQLYLEGPISAGEDLTLIGQDTVTIRDTPTTAFIAQSGNELIIQGNEGIDIWTLQHLEHTPFTSGGDLLLISDGEISGDAHFESGGNLEFLTLAGTPGNFISFHDPIIFADGDVIFGDYEGVALKVEATGNIQADNIRITGPDTTLTTDGSGSDEDLLASSSAAILRAGVQSVSNANTLHTEGATTITKVPATSQNQGSIVVTTINTMSTTDGGPGGPIILTADGDITTFENLDSLSRSSTGDANNGGSISISSISGNITINGRLSSFSQTLGDGSSGNGANITVSSISGDITTNEKLNSFSFVSSPTSGGSAGNAGNISVSSISGNISINDRANAFSSSSSDGGSSDGGDISIFSTSGDISINRLDSSSSFFAPEPDINTPSSIAPTGDGGDVFVSTMTGDISITGFLASLSTSRNGDVGSGGNISLFAKEGSILGTDNNQISTTSISGASGNTGLGGKVTLQAATSISDLEISTISSDGVSGDVELQGTGNNLTISNLRLITSGQEETLNPAVNDGQTTDLEDNEFEKSGRTIISSLRDLTLNNIEILSDANRSANAGNVEISSPGKIQLNNSQIFSNTNVLSSGQGGDIIIRNADVALLSNTELVTSSDGSGNAGNILIEDVDILLLRQASLIQAGASDKGDGGNVDINATIVIAVPDENSDILADTNSGTGGNINITAAGILGFRIVETFSNNLDRNSISDLSARSERGNDGTITLTTPNIDPNQGLLELPANLTDQSALIAERCLADSGQGESTFVVTGRGGVPPSPSEVTRSETTALVDWETYTASVESDENTTVLSNAPSDYGLSREQISHSSQLVEAQHWVVDDETGEVQLLALDEPNTVQKLAHQNYACPTS